MSRLALTALVLSLLIAPIGAAADERETWAALVSGGHVALVRHGNAPPGYGDPPGFKLDDCSTQRNLSPEGRAQAVRMGDLLRADGITSARLYSSPWCRCIDTATLMKLGEVTRQPLLAFTRQFEALRAWIGQLELVQPTLMVTHQLVISGVAETGAGDGEIIVMRRETDGRLTVQGRRPTL